jgi:tetratricopeptide (TPR) repeat protein
VVALQPRHYASWVDTAAIRSTQGDFAGALDAADRAVAIRPGAPSGHVMRGFALRSLARFADAHASFERALALPDAQPDALFGLAATALDLGDLRAAQGGFERLVRVAPTADAYRGLVESYRRAGRLPDADRAAAVARARFPGDPYFAR